MAVCANMAHCEHSKSREIKHVKDLQAITFRHVIMQIHFEFVNKDYPSVNRSIWMKYSVM